MNHLDVTSADTKGIRRRILSLRRCVVIAAVLCAGVAASGLLFHVMRGSELDRARTDFKRAAENRVSALKREVEEHLLIAESVQCFFAGSEEVRRDEFRVFVTPLLRHHPDIQALEWIPRVPDAQRAACEAAARSDGFSGFQITERKTQGRMVPAQRRREYYPVYFAEPHEGNETALGFDLASNPTRLEALTLARDTGRMAVTSRITLVQERGGQFGFLMFLPVYRKGAPADSVRARRENIEGFVLGVYRIGDLMAHALSHLEPQGVDIRLLDESAAPGDRFLLFYRSRTRKGSTSARPAGETDARADFSLADSIKVADRKWSVLCTSAPGCLAARTTWQPWGALVAGLLLTALAGAYLATITIRGARVERLAARLSQANRQLESEVSERRRAEGKARAAREKAERISAELAERAEQLEAARQASLNMVDDLERAREAAEIASEAKSEFLANMSHEIRTPMTAILGYADLLADHGLSPSDRDNHLAVIRRNGEHLLGLINDILDLSKIEAGKLAMELRRCSLVSVVADIASMMRARAEETGISLSVSYAGRLPETILTDAARLRQALVNLVGNAVKFTERGGVRVVVSFVPQWRGNQPAVRVEVADTGIGISKDRLGRLFEPFAQADASTSRKYGGTGLGLAIARHIAELLGGQLTAESVPDKGSTFTLTVPTGSLEGVCMLDRPEEAARAPAANAPDAAGENLAGIRILLAEDGIDNRRLISAFLRKAGAEVEIAENGRAAVEKTSAGRFDVILMDIQMPEMDGYQAARALRERGFTGPVLALTAHAMSGDREKCLAAGCDDHLTKPIDRSGLIRAIAKHAGVHSPPENAGADSKPDAPGAADETLRSKFADEAPLAEVIDRFVAGLHGHVEAMREALSNGDHDRLRRLAHRMKGAGGSYGYPELTEAAGKLEDAAKAGDTEAAALALAEFAEISAAAARGRSVAASKET